MITSLNGALIEKSPVHAVVECHGVGYLVSISLNTFSALPDKGQVRLLVHYAVSVDVRSGASEHKLFGFSDPQERDLFRQLVQVQGVSSTIGMSLLSSMPSADLTSAIMGGDLSALKSIKGIGPKLAQRIIGELAEKLGKGMDGMVQIPVGGKGNTLRSEALTALISLGMDRNKAERALQGVLKDREGQEMQLEDVIRATLKNL